MTSRAGALRRAAVPAYYAVVGLLLLLAVTGRLGTVLPGPVARHVGEDSEALLLALVVPAWVQGVRPRLRGTRAEPWATGAAAAACLALGLLLYTTDGLPGRVETLNEPVLALALLLPYVQLRRPLPLAAVLALPGGVVLLLALASSTALVTDLAEGLVMVLLLPVGLDLVDRCVLEPGGGRRSRCAARGTPRSSSCRCSCRSRPGRTRPGRCGTPSGCRSRSSACCSSRRSWRSLRRPAGRARPWSGDGAAGVRPEGWPLRCSTVIDP